MTKTRCLILAVSAALLSHPAHADWLAELESPAPIASSDGLVVRAVGSSNPDLARDEAHARSLAAKTARVLAHERLAERLDGLRLSSETKLRNELLVGSTVQASVRSQVRGARVVEESFTKRPDGSIACEVTLAWGGGAPREQGHQPALAAPAPTAPSSPRPADSTPAQAPPLPPSALSVPSHAGPPPSEIPPVTHRLPTHHQDYSGLIVDATGLGARAVVDPRIVTESGHVIYDRSQADRKFARRKGLVEYAHSIEAARAFKRLGDRPLIVRAQRLGGPTGKDLIVSDEAAALATSTISRHDLYHRCSVVILLD